MTKPESKRLAVANGRPRKTQSKLTKMVVFIAVTGCALALGGATGCDKHDHHKHTTLSGGEAAAGSIYDLKVPFTDAKGKAATPGDLKGSPVVVSMIYTRCQSICPALAGNMLTIQKGLPPKDRARTKFLLVSFDNGDTTADLATFAGKLKMDDRWTLLRGEEDSIRQIAAALGFQYRRAPDGNFAHSATTYLLNGKGEVVFRKDGTVGAPEEFAQQIKAL